MTQWTFFCDQKRNSVGQNFSWLKSRRNAVLDHQLDKKKKKKKKLLLNEKHKI